jgi:hypothetical protein
MSLADLVFLGDSSWRRLTDLEIFGNFLLRLCAYLTWVAWFLSDPLVAIFGTFAMIAFYTALVRTLSYFLTPLVNHLSHFFFVAMAEAVAEAVCGAHNNTQGALGPTQEL